MNRSPQSTLDKIVFLDANILLEIILGRDKESIARKFIESRNDKLCISALTAHLVVHFGQAIVTLPILRKFLADYNLLSIEKTDFDWAFTNIRGIDFEDALQIAVAVRNGCAIFVTFDKLLASTYKGLASIEVVLLN